jgi:lysine-N-methylase
MLMAKPPQGIHSGVPSLPRPLPGDPRPQTTTAAMERFACIAERCEDTCCRDWAVSIDRPSLDRLKGVMARTPEGRDRLVRLVVLGSPSRHADALGQVQLDERGVCLLLEPDNRCSVHAAFGEEALPTTCAILPRTAIAVADRVEVGGSLGCPEVARLTLLSDGEMTMRPARQPMLTRAYVGKTVGGDRDLLLVWPPGDAGQVRLKAGG